MPAGQKVTYVKLNSMRRPQTCLRVARLWTKSVRAASRRHEMILPAIQGVRRLFQRFVKFNDPPDYTFQPVADDLMIFNFKSKDDIKEWDVLSDADLGGKSAAQFTTTSAGKAVFYGRTVMECPKGLIYSGFASVRMRERRVSGSSRSLRLAALDLFLFLLLVKQKTKSVCFKFSLSLSLSLSLSFFLSCVCVCVRVCVCARARMHMCVRVLLVRRA